MTNHISIDRIRDRHAQIAGIGALSDGGVSRLALSNEDKQAREVLRQWMEELDLEITQDDLGNMYGLLPGTGPALEPIVLGSHLDSVPNGGTFDGVIGVLAGLEVLQSVRETGQTPRRSLLLVNFTNEEGARFPIPMISSGVLSGTYTIEKMMELPDQNHITIEQELKRLDLQGDKTNRLQRAYAFLELHIEQGPVLEDKNRQIGIVKGIQGLSWHEFTIVGDADHAGPSPMASRADAGIMAMKVILALHEWVLHLEDQTTITFGQIKTEPFSINVIPGKTTFSVDIRHPDKTLLDERLVEMMTLVEKTMAQEPGSWEEASLSYMPPVTFHAPFLKELESICREQRFSYSTMFSGAGHDAMHISKFIPTVMLFVPSIGGKSHHPAELSRWEDIDQAVQLMYEWTTRHCY